MMALSQPLAPPAVRGATLAQAQRQKMGAARVYLNFAINCHDWVNPKLSSATVLRAARFLAKHGVKADFYVTGPLCRAWAEKAPGTIEELTRLGMGLGYHQRMPHPIFFPPTLRALIGKPPGEVYQTLVRYESEELDLRTGNTVPGKAGGYALVKQKAGDAPLALGAGTAPPYLMAMDREILRRMGARMVVAYHSRGDEQYPLIWWQGLLARPSDFSVVRVPPNSRQRAAGRNVLPRGTAAGEEAGSFWWAAIHDPEAQPHRPARYLESKMAGLPRDRVTYVTSLIHENNWYLTSNSFNAIYYEGRAKRRPRRPPFDIEGTPRVPLRPKGDTEKIWQWWEELVKFVAANRQVRVVTAADLLHRVRRDDLERTYDRQTLEAAARQLTEVDSFPPQFLVVSGAAGEDALSLSDAVQAITRAIAAEPGKDPFAVRTMLGPIRDRGPRRERGAAPPLTSAFTARAADVRAAARRLVSEIQKPGQPDALPATVRIGDHEAELEAYLYAAAKVLLGAKGTLEVPALKQASPDPARWTIKPARMAQ